MERKKVLVTGGTGLVGSALCSLLQKSGFEVGILSRKAGMEGGMRRYAWDYAAGNLDAGALEGTHFLIHLAGAGIADARWTKARKKEILGSRVDSALFLAEKFRSAGLMLDAFVSSSAIGIYGDAGTGMVSEEDVPSNPSATDFLMEVCKKWEGAAGAFGHIARRTVIIRTGIVLSTKGGALAKMLPLIRLGLGSPLGTGRQMMSWVHIDDLCRIYQHALLDARMDGVYNGVGDKPLSNRDFTEMVGAVLKKPVWLPPVPLMVFQLLFGEMAQVVLTGASVSNEKIKKQGFTFGHSNPAEAVKDLVSCQR